MIFILLIICGLRILTIFSQKKLKFFPKKFGNPNFVRIFAM